MSKNSIDKMAEQFNSVEELQAYSQAQYKTILGLNEKLTKLLVELETLKAENARIKNKQAIESSVPADSKFKVTDEETICVTQLSILKQSAMERELTMDEVKRAEILVKTLQIIRGKVEEKPKGKDPTNVSTEDLLKFFDKAPTEDPQ